MASVLRLVSSLLVLALALVSFSVMPSAASASPRTQASAHAKHAVAKATQGAVVRAAVPAEAPSDPWASVDDDDEDDDGDDDTADPDDFAPAPRLPLPGPGDGYDSDFGIESQGRAAPGTRELPEDPPEPT